MNSLAVWDDIEIYTDTIGLVVILQLAQIEVYDFYSCNDMIHETSVTKHKVGWEIDLSTLSLKDKTFLAVFCLSKQIRKELTSSSRWSWKIVRHTGSDCPLSRAGGEVSYFNLSNSPHHRQDTVFNNLVLTGSPKGSLKNVCQISYN